MDKIKLLCLLLLLSVSLNCYSQEYIYSGAIIQEKWGTNFNQVFFDNHTGAPGLEFERYPTQYTIDYNENIILCDGSTHPGSNNRIKIFDSNGLLSSIINLNTFIRLGNLIKIEPKYIYTLTNKYLLIQCVFYSTVSNYLSYILLSPDYINYKLVDSEYLNLTNIYRFYLDKAIGGSYYYLNGVFISDIDGWLVSFYYKFLKYSHSDFYTMDYYHNYLSFFHTPTSMNIIFRDEYYPLDVYYDGAAQYRTDIDGNVFFLRRHDYGIYIYKYEKIDYLPVAATPLAAGQRCAFAAWNGELATFDLASGVLTAGTRTVRLQGALPSGANPRLDAARLGIDRADNVFLLSGRTLRFWKKNGNALRDYTLPVVPDAVTANIDGLAARLAVSNSVVYRFYTAAGERLTDETALRAGGWDVVETTVPIDRYRQNFVNGFAIRYNGENVRRFKLGAGSTVLEKELLAVDDEGNVWVRVVWRDGADQVVRGQVVKFDALGNWLNAVYLDADSGYSPYSRCVVLNSRRICLIESNRVVMLERENLIAPQTAEAKIRLAAYLSTNAYAGATRNYATNDLRPPAAISEDLIRLQINYAQFLVNEINARRGYDFQTPLWKEIYSKVRWYRTSRNVNLNATERRNVEFLTPYRQFDVWRQMEAIYEGR